MNLENQESRRLWQVSRILNESPFSDEVMSLTDQQMNWIMKMHASDNPEVQLIDDSVSIESTVTAKWHDVLTGSSLAQFIGDRIPQHVKDRIKSKLSKDNHARN